MNFATLDWIMLSVFALLLVAIVIFTNRITKSVAGFLSSERCAGRYLLTIAQSMAFCSAIGAVSQYENIYRSGISGKWWGLLMAPVGAALALSGWVIYRFRETRCLTIAELLEKRYSRRFRIYAGITAFTSGILNCAVFPLVTAHFIMYLLGLPQSWSLAGLSVSTHLTVMLIMVGTGATLALAGGQITIMVTDFFQGIIGTAAVIAVIIFALVFVGWGTIISTLERSEEIRLLRVDAEAQENNPEWFEAKARPVRAFHDAVRAEQPDLFAVLRRNAEVMDALSSGVARVLETTLRGERLALPREVTLTQELLDREAAAPQELQEAVEGALEVAAQRVVALESQAAELEEQAAALEAEDAELGDQTRGLAQEAATQAAQATGDAAVLRALTQDEVRGLAMNFPAASLIVGENYPDAVEKLNRPEGSSMMNPLLLGSEGAFSIPFFLMSAFMIFAGAGVWQGGVGYMTAARTPHEAKMGGILSGWRWMAIGTGGEVIAVVVYVLMWNNGFGAEQEAILAVSEGVVDPFLQSQQFVPMALGQVLPAGLLGLFTIYMVGASISTDDSAYHSWGSIFLQDVVMPFRKKPFERKQHLRYLRCAIAGVAVFSVVFSSFFELRDFINMWWQITMAIYIGGAMSAVIGGLYWKGGTTAGAWTGMISGSVLSLAGIAWQQLYPGVVFPSWVWVFAGEEVNGLHLACFNVVVSFGLYVVVSLLDRREPYNLEKLLHRGAYTVEEDDVVAGEVVADIEAQEAAAAAAEAAGRRPWLLRKLGITREFSRFDIFIYVAFLCWTVAHSVVFLGVTGWYLTLPEWLTGVTSRPASESWVWAWTWYLALVSVMIVITGVWYAIGGARDAARLVHDVRTKELDESDDGFVAETAPTAGGGDATSRNEA